MRFKGWILTSALILASACILHSCETTKLPVPRLTQHWKPGTTQRYLVHVVDSGLVQNDIIDDIDSTVHVDVQEYEVLLMIMDTVSGPVIEWKQFIHDHDTSHNRVHEVLLTKILYRCDRFGRYAGIINAESMKAYNDSMFRLIGAERGIDTATIEAIIMTTTAYAFAGQFEPLLQQFHGFYGAEVLSGDTMEGISYLEDSIVARSEFAFVLHRTEDRCHGSASAFHSWALCDSVDLQKELSVLPVQNRDQQWGLMRNEIRLCADTVSTLPTELLFRREVIAGRTKAIYTVRMSSL